MDKNKIKISDKREKQTRYLSQAIQLEEAVNPHIVRATMMMISIAILIFIIWAGFTNINEISRTPGEVVPKGHQQTVQHLEGGIIDSIFVHEGRLVKKGQILLKVSDKSIDKDLKRAKAKQLNLEMQGERMRAFLNKRDLDFSKFNNVSQSVIDDQIDFFNGMRHAREKERAILSDQLAEKIQAIKSLDTDLETMLIDLKIAKDMLGRRQKLNRRGYTSDMQVLDNERQVNQISGEIKNIENKILVAKAEIHGYEVRLSSMDATHRDEILEQLSNITAERNQNQEVIEKLEERIGRMDVRAPTDGLVKGFKINTIGAVIQPGQTLMELIPLEKGLEVLVKISPQDIGHLELGQDVQVKFSSFDFSRYGSVKGKLDYISAMTFNGDNSSRYYEGRVILKQNYVGGDVNNIILPGMTVMADIITGQKTILQYMLKPIHISLKTAFTER